MISNWGHPFMPSINKLFYLSKKKTFQQIQKQEQARQIYLQGEDDVESSASNDDPLLNSR